MGDEVTWLGTEGMKLRGESEVGRTAKKGHRLLVSRGEVRQKVWVFLLKK